MRGRSSIQQVASILSRRNLQTTQPLPPPVSPLPPTTPNSDPTSPSPARLRSIQAKQRAISHLPPINPPQSASPLPTSLSSAIKLLKSQSTNTSGIYLIARLFSRTFLLHPRDIISLPRLKSQPPPGTILKLTRVQEVGSRDYAIRAPSSDSKVLRKLMDYDARTLPDIPEGVVTCELTVLEHTRSPQEIRFKMKRRKGYRKTIKSKHAWTRVKVGDIVLNEPKEA